jgi:tetratricopeptide (TPR) repeat protein
LRRVAIFILYVTLLAGCGSKAVTDAQAFVDVKEYGRAQELLDLELKTDPKNEAAYLLLGKVHLLSGNDDEAKKAFETALLLDKENKDQIAGIYQEVAAAVYADSIKDAKPGELPQGTYRALGLFEQALTYDPAAKKDLRAWALREARTTTQLQKTVAPMALLAGMLRIDPEARAEAASLAMDTATAYHERSFHHDAAAWAQAAAAWDPKHLTAAAAILRATGLAEKDRRYLLQAVQWHRAYANDEAVAWTLHTLGSMTPQEYLRRFPSGAHAAEIQRVFREREAAGTAASSDGLVAYYPFEDPEWFTDKTAGVVLGRYTNCARVRGPKGWALELLNGYATLQPLGVLPGDFTISLLVKSTGHGQLFAKSIRNHHVLGIGHTNARTPQGVAFSFNGGEVDAYSTTNVLDGQWHHLAAIKRGMTAELWVDGEQEASVALPHDYTSDPGTFGIGRMGEIDGQFLGTFDELKIWRRALDSAEIRGEAQPVRQRSS